MGVLMVINMTVTEKDILVDRGSVLKTILINDYFYSENNFSEKIRLAILPFFVDIAVFKDNQPHIIDNLLLACDTTSNNIDECLEKMKQLTEFINSNFYSIYFNENDMKIFKYINEKNEIIEHYAIPNINQSSLNLYKKDLMFTDDLLRIIEIIHNHIYANEGFATNEVFNELVKILMIKYIDEQKKGDEQLEFYVTEDELSDMKKSLFVKKINKLYKHVTDRYPNLFNSYDEIKLSPNVLAFTIAQLQRYNLFDMDSDVKGLLFQKIINSGQKGERGQFFTPDPVVTFMVNFINPQSDQKILDPACGTGGFLRTVISYIRNNKNNNTYSEEYIKEKIFGIEINPSIARVANLRFIFEGSNATNVMCYNALSDIKALDNNANKNMSNVKFQKDTYDVILTNPPFGSQGKITDKKVLASFDLGHKWSGKKRGVLQTGQVPDILFIERCIELLKPGGKLGIVLPNGDLENLSLEYVRSYIFERCKLIAVIKLPEQAFVPFGTGVKASILFLEKKKDGDSIENKDVFFARINKLGYSYNKNANILYKRGSSGEFLLSDNGKQIIDEDYSVILDNYKQYLENGDFDGTDNCFLVKAQDIQGRLDFEYYEPRYMKNIAFLKERSSATLKSVAKIPRGKSTVLKQKDKMVRYIEISDINPSTSEIISCTELPVFELPSRATFEVRVGDIITSVAGNAIGTERHASAIVTEEYDRCICTNGFRVIKPFAVDPYYLIYYLKSDYFLKQIFRLRTGAAIPSISDEDFNNLLILMPNKVVLSEIISRVKLSFELRAKARELLNQDLSVLLNNL